MVDDLPPISFVENNDGAAIVRIAAVEVDSRAELLDVAPFLLDPEHVVLYAQAVNHLAHGYDFIVIEDPAAFKKAYDEKLAEEAKDPGPHPGVARRLSTFGRPDLDQITAPAIDGDKLTFYAEQVFLGIPYKVEAAASQTAIGEPSYKPMEMKPLP